MTRRRPHQPRYHTTHLLKHLPTSPTRAAELLGVSRETINRWHNPKTTISTYQADHYAIRIGLHPGNIWPNWFDINH